MKYLCQLQQAGAIRRSVHHAISVDKKYYTMGGYIVMGERLIPNFLSGVRMLYEKTDSEDRGRHSGVSD